MGNVLELMCSRCSYKQNINIGAGMADGNLEAVLKRFDNSTQKDIGLWMKHNGFFRHNADIVLTYCRRCKEYRGMQTITLYTKSNESEVFCSKCPECMLIPLEPDDEKQCPKCGKAIKLEIVGEWD